MLEISVQLIRLFYQRQVHLAPHFFCMIYLFLLQKCIIEGFRPLLSLPFLEGTLQDYLFLL